METSKWYEDIDWRTSAFLTAIHVVPLIGLPFYFMATAPSLGLIITTAIVGAATGISITAGYHRLYSHKAYKASKIMEFPLLVFGTMAMQSSVAYWAHKHRLHHTYVDTEKDPHNIRKGFMWAHVGWLYKNQIPIDEKLIPDILNNKLAAFQHKYYHYLTFGLNIGFVLILWAAFGDFWGALLIGWLLRGILVNNATWFINSLAHTWGDRSYSREQTAVNNAIIALVTFGEGYHNYHHVFATDYRNGVKWYQFDPTKWLIWTCSKLGLAKDLKKFDIFTAQKAMVNEDKKLLIETIDKTKLEKKEEWKDKVTTAAESLLQKLTEVKTAYRTYVEEKKQKKKPNKTELKKLTKSYKQDWSNWLQLNKQIMRVA